MKSTRKKVTASILTAVICLSAATAVTTTAVSAAETNSVSVMDKHDMTNLRDGVWLGVGVDGSYTYFEVNNIVNTMHVNSVEKNIGIPVDYDYNWATGVYNVRLGCPDVTETWQLTSNDGSFARMFTDSGKYYSLFFLGSGSLSNYYSIEQLRDMAKNVFESRGGNSKNIQFSSFLRQNASGLVDIKLVDLSSYNNTVIDIYTIDVKTGFGWDSNHCQIDFNCFK